MDVGDVLRKGVIEHNLSEDFDTLELFIISDVHVGDNAYEEQAFLKFVDEIASVENRYVILAGDLIDNALKHSKTNSYKATMSPRDQKKYICRVLDKIKHKILCIVDGNHEMRSSDASDNNVGEDIAMILGVQSLYREDEAVLKITFGKKENSRRQCYTANVFHGSGGGATPGAAINSVVRRSNNIVADFYVCGHFHNKVVHKNRVRLIDLQNKMIRYVTRLFVVSSSWKGYMEGWEAIKGFVPGEPGSVKIILHSKVKRMDAII